LPKPTIESSSRSARDAASRKEIRSEPGCFAPAEGPPPPATAPSVPVLPASAPTPFESVQSVRWQPGIRKGRSSLADAPETPDGLRVLGDETSFETPRSRRHGPDPRDGRLREERQVLEAIVRSSRGGTSCGRRRN